MAAHICSLKIHKLGHDLPKSVNDSGFAISRVLNFHETKAFAKISNLH